MQLEEEEEIENEKKAKEETTDSNVATEEELKALVCYDVNYLYILFVSKKCIYTKWITCCTAET